MKKKRVRHLVPMEEIRKILIDERMRRRLPQKEIAERMGISESWLSNMESGNRDIRWDVWVRWCLAIRISPSTVMDKWFQSFEGKEEDEVRKNHYHDIVNDMIALNFNPELDVLMVYFQGLVQVEKAERRKQRMQRQYRKWHEDLDFIRKNKDKEEKDEEEDS